jgi:hypothetical protein
VSLSWASPMGHPGSRLLCGPRDQSRPPGHTSAMSATPPNPLLPDVIVLSLHLAEMCTVIDNDNAHVTCSVETPVATFGSAAVKLKAVVSCQSTFLSGPIPPVEIELGGTQGAIRRIGTCKCGVCLSNVNLLSQIMTNSNVTYAQ